MGERGKIVVLEERCAESISAQVNFYLDCGYVCSQGVEVVRVRGKLRYWCVMLLYPEEEGK